jgi:hypothetical protein
MSVPKHRGLIVHQQRYRPSDSNKNVDIKFGAHEAFLLFKTLMGGGVFHRTALKTKN